MIIFKCDRCKLESEIGDFLHRIAEENRLGGGIDHNKTLGDICGACLEDIKQFFETRDRKLTR